MPITRQGSYGQSKGNPLTLPCRVATTAAITLSGTQTIDAIAVVADDRVLVKNQASGATNGIYIVAAGAWIRAIDMSLSDDVYEGVQIYVNAGTANGAKSFVLTTANPITLDTTALTFVVNSSGGGVTGTLTANYIPKATGTSTISNSLIYDDGTTVLIGTTSTPTPVVGVAFPISINSSDTTRIRINSTKASPNAGVGLYANDVQKFSFAMYLNSGSYDFTIYNDALLSASMLVKGDTNNILVGTTSDNGSKLQINGTGYFNGNLQSTGQFYSPINSKGNSGTGTVTFSWNDGNTQTVTLTGTCTFAFSNPQSGAVYRIIITQDATGGRSITWPTIHWEGKTVPGLTGTASSRDIVTLIYDGSLYNGTILLNVGTP